MRTTLKEFDEHDWIDPMQIERVEARSYRSVATTYECWRTTAYMRSGLTTIWSFEKAEGIGGSSRDKGANKKDAALILKQLVNFVNSGKVG